MQREELQRALAEVRAVYAELANRPFEMGVSGSQKDSNKAGFTWIAKNLRPASGVDQLAELRKEIAGSKNASKPKTLTAPAAGAKK